MTYITPSWPAPSHIKAFATTRSGGVSNTPYDSFNLGHHVGDNLEKVKENRQRLKERLHLPEDPAWLEQVHGNRIVTLDKAYQNEEADGSYTMQKNKVCAILTADCLPVLLCDKEGKQVAALHGGWRSLAGNILEKAVKLFKSNPENILAWLGPAIGPKAFELGLEVKEQFVSQHSLYEKAFKPKENKCLGNIYEIARVQLHNAGVDAIYGGDFCTYTDKERFFSYRRDKNTGRMATLIWME